MSGFFVCIFDFISMNGFIIDIYTGNATNQTKIIVIRVFIG